MLPSRDVGVPGWQFCLDDLATDVDCSGASHTIVWRRGKLVLIDHDLAAERAASALGGELPRCVQVLYAWRRARRNARFVAIDDETLRYFRARNLRLGEPFQAALLPEPLRRLRERTTWLHALRTGADRQKATSVNLAKTIRRLAELVLDRAVEPLRASMEIVPSANVLPRGEPARARGKPGGGHVQIAEVFLPTEWLATVALLDLVDLDGRLVLSIAPADGRTGAGRAFDAALLGWRTTPNGGLAADITTARVERASSTWNLRQ